MWAKSKQSGFTIVELLIVIVVIGILAAITLIAYNGIQNRAKVASVQSDLTTADKLLQSDKITKSVSNGAEIYPSDLTAAKAAGIKASSGNTFTGYIPTNTINPANYCLTETSGTTDYSITATSGGSLLGTCVTNISINPSAETAITPWNCGAACTIGRVPDTMFGGYAIQHSVAAAGTSYVYSNGTTSGVAVTALDPISATLSVKNVTGGTRNFSLGLVWRDAAGTPVGTQANGANFSVALGATAALTASGVVPAGAATVQVQARSTSGSAGDVYEWDGLIITKTTSPYSYGAGDSPGWYWGGTASNSFSVGPAQLAQ